MRTFIGVRCDHCGKRSRTPSSHKDTAGRLHAHWYRHHTRTKHPDVFEKEFGPATEPARHKWGRK